MEDTTSTNVKVVTDLLPGPVISHLDWKKTLLVHLPRSMNEFNEFDITVGKIHQNSNIDYHNVNIE